MFRKLSCIFLVLPYLCSCEQNGDRQMLQDLHMLEWSRVSDTAAYQPFRKSERTGVRAELCLTIGKVQAPELYPVLAGMVNDPDPEVVRAAIFALGQMREDRSTALLISLTDDPAFDGHRAEIIRALGKSESGQAHEFLIQKLDLLPDSVLSTAIRSVAFLTGNDTRKRSAAAIKKYLAARSAAVTAAAVYFFARHADPTILIPMIRVNCRGDALSEKYRFRAIEKAIGAAGSFPADSTVKDSLWRELRTALQKRESPWQTRLYQIGILRAYDDSLAGTLAAGQLQDSIPHIREKAIHTLGAKNSDYARKILLNYYNQATWGEKGNIIYAISRQDRNLAYRLIQQNLDQGTPYFKQLLLRSLANIRDRASLAQLRQFLQVPNVHLQHTAFAELNALNLITYDQVRRLLGSGDMVLVWLAADWIRNHPDKAQLKDLIAAFHMFDEQRDSEPMVALLTAVSALNDREAIPFLKTVLENTRKKTIADEALKGLTRFDVKLQALPRTQDSLFVPPGVMGPIAPVMIRVTTGKGDIVLQLNPDAAPLTVANFLYLIRKGFYQKTAFHRVVSDFVIQAGDPRGDGWGGPGYSIPCEYNRLPFERGTLGMATAGKDTGGSQFFICHSEQPHLDRRYTVFGQVVSGLEVVDKIEIDDQITQITILN